VEPRADEAELLARAVQGDFAAFNFLVEHYQGAVYNLCLRLIGSPQGAEDTAQDAFIAAYRRLDTFRGGNFRAWLFRIASNACYDELRWRKSRPAVSLDEPAGREQRTLDVADAAPSPEQQAEDSELREAIQAALSQLPYEQRMAIILCDSQGMDYAEIAQLMACSLGTVKSRIARGRSRLREILLADAELLPSRFRPKSEEP
jgi:RNA polymerase sigma-70 factor (ECF subfamily)